MPAAVAAAHGARAVLSGVRPESSLVALAILLIASLAAYLPARRASRIDPVAAVR